ncbi:LamG domain-containing protein [bacterium]|nr:LamG domain-containing protein [bacterium]
MKRLALLLAVLAVPAVMFISCSQNNPIAPNTAPSQGKMMFALDAADNIATGQVTVTKGALTHVLPITIADHSGSVIFEPIQVGHWDILVQLYDVDGVEIYTGTGEAIVTKDATTTVTIRVEHNTGTLIIQVEVPGLLLWNKLGSVTEVQNSESGPNGTITGSISYDSVQFGNGAINDDRYSYIGYDNSVFDGEKGTIEYWVKPNFAMVNGYAQTAKSNARYWVHQNPGSSWFLMAVDDQAHSSQFKVIIVGASGVLVTPNLNWSSDENVHIALIYDRNAGFDGSKTIAVYQDGVEVGYSTEDWGNYDVGSVPFTVLNGIVGSGALQKADAYIDNLKIWNYSKTDFSDRFVE